MPDSHHAAPPAGHHPPTGHGPGHGPGHAPGHGAGHGPGHGPGHPPGAPGAHPPGAPGANAPGHPPARPAPRPRDDDEEEDGGKKKPDEHPHGLHALILAHPFFWGVPTVVLVATLCGFLGAYMALRLGPPPKQTVVEERIEVAGECRNIEVQFGLSADLIERNMLERMHDRLGCDPARLAGTLSRRQQ